MGELDAITDIPALNRWLDDYCKAVDYIGWHHYGPADLLSYESEPVRILLVNAESYGYDKVRGATKQCEYLQWVRSGNRTPVRSSIFTCMLRQFIEIYKGGTSMPAFEPFRWSRSGWKLDELCESMKGTAYMNARVTSNGSGVTKEQKREINSQLMPLAAYRRRLYQLLRPQIVVCGGISAVNCMFCDGGPFPSASRRNESVFAVDTCLIIWSGHFSRVSRRALYETAIRAANEYVRLISC